MLKSEEPFTKAHGKNLFDWMKLHPATSKNFKDAFINSSIHLIPLILSEYNGFESVHKLMDVGGSSGMMLAGIVEKYPHIQAINFDLPEVVTNNPSLPGKRLPTIELALLNFESFISVRYHAALHTVGTSKFTDSFEGWIGSGIVSSA